MVVLLKGHDIKLPLSIYIYTDTQELLSILTIQASFVEMALNTKTHGYSKC